MIKSYLRQYRPLLEEIERLNIQISIVRNSRPQTGSGRNGSGNHGDPTAATVMRVETLREKRDKLLVEFNQVVGVINKGLELLDVEEMQVINVYYLDPLPCGILRMTDAIGARRLHWSIRTFERKKRSAIGKMEGVAKDAKN